MILFIKSSRWHWKHTNRTITGIIINLERESRVHPNTILNTMLQPLTKHPRLILFETMVIKDEILICLGWNPPLEGASRHMNTNPRFNLLWKALGDEVSFPEVMWSPAWFAYRGKCCKDPRWHVGRCHLLQETKINQTLGPDSGN